MPKARKKPVVIEYLILENESDDAHNRVLDWIHGNAGLDAANRVRPDGVRINTLEGAMYASVGDVVIRGVKGEFYPCKPDIFAATYEIVEEA